MSLGVLIPLLTCIGACAVAGAVVARVPTRRVGWLVLAAFGSVFAWAGCQLIWSQAADAASAIRWMRLGAVGMLLGPLALHVFLEASPARAGRLRRVVHLAYLSTLALIGVEVASPWVMVAAVPVPWGWAYEPGPLFAAAYLLTAGCVGIAWTVVLRGDPRRPEGSRRARSASEGLPGPRVARVGTTLLVAIPLTVGTLTDFVLPMLGEYVPPLGSLCVVTIAALARLGSRRLGYWVLSPQSFATEILETLPDGVALLRDDHRVRVANGRLAALLSLPRRETLGCNVDEYLPEPLPEGSTREVERETSLRLPTGVSVPVSVTTRLLRDRQGEPIGQVLALRDQREVVGLRARLVASARMAALGELAAGIAHEVNNPIAFIQTNLNLLGQHLTAVRDGLTKASDSGAVPAAADRGARLVTASRDEVERIASIVREVRGFAHLGPGGRIPADVNELLDSAARVATPLLRGHVELERSYGEVPSVVCAPQELKQLFLSLVVAAARAAGDPGRLRLSTKASSDGVDVFLECSSGPAADEITRLFDPFLGESREPTSGEPVGDLGLVICEQIVAAHEGELGVESDPHGRTRIHVRLPLATRDEGREDEAVDGEREPGTAA